MFVVHSSRSSPKCVDSDLEAGGSISAAMVPSTGTVTLNGNGSGANPFTDDEVHNVTNRRFRDRRMERMTHMTRMDDTLKWRFFLFGILVCCCLGGILKVLELTWSSTAIHTYEPPHTNPTTATKRNTMVKDTILVVQSTNSLDNIASPPPPSLVQDESYVCEWFFVGYEPSAWEMEWSTNIATWQTRVCETLTQSPHSDRSMLMVMKVQEWQLADHDPHHKEPVTEAIKAKREPVSTWSSKELDQQAEALMSKNKFELRCRRLKLSRPPGSPVDESKKNSASSTTYSDVPHATDSFVAATGYDFLEPLIGLLRDPLTICQNQVTRTPAIAALRRDISWSTQEAMQSKRFVLPLSATPYHVESISSTSLMADQRIPAFLTPKLAGEIMQAIQLIIRGTGLPPWTHRGSHLLQFPRSSDGATNWSYLHQPYISQDANAQLVYSMSAGEWTTTTSGITEEEQQTGIFLSVRDTGDQSHFDSITSSIAVPSSLASRGWFKDPSGRSLSRGGPRHLLFDFGASYFGNWRADSSAQGSSWFYNQMKKKGLNFDHVWAFEYQKLDPYEEWKMIPADLYPGFTFINAGVESDPKSRQNPWNTLLQVARQSDYVIIKLDIDTPSIEIPLFQQILSEPILQGLIDEMYFEHHVDVKEMRHWWGDNLPEQLTHSYTYFTKLREIGIRMHSWP